LTEVLLHLVVAHIDHNTIERRVISYAPDQRLILYIVEVDGYRYGSLAHYKSDTVVEQSGGESNSPRENLNIDRTTLGLSYR
jgi:hypothetical protein